MKRALKEHILNFKPVLIFIYLQSWGKRAICLGTDLLHIMKETCCVYFRSFLKDPPKQVSGVTLPVIRHSFQVRLSKKNRISFSWKTKIKQWCCCQIWIVKHVCCAEFAQVTLKQNMCSFAVWVQCYLSRRRDVFLFFCISILI